MLSQNMIINKTLNTKDISVVTLNDLTANYFFNYKAEFLFILNHYKTYGAVPDKVTFVNSFPDFELQEVSEPDNYLLEQLYKDYNTNYIATRFNSMKKMLENDKTDEAVQYLLDSVEHLHSGSVLQPVDILKDTSRYDHYLERTTNWNQYYISTGFPELDKIIGGIDCKNENMVIAARTGIGKCLAKGTKILMADGTTKAVEDVKVGDRVQSYNQVNTVLDLHNGTSNGYKIIPNKGDPFIVSSNHILTLICQNEVYNKAKRYKTTDGTAKLIDITIEDYLASSKHFKHRCKLFRPAVDYTTKEQNIDPYILGAWLGDGISSQSQICSADQEIIEAIHNYGTIENYEVHDLPSQQEKCHVFSLVGRGTSDYFINKLGSLNLINNKHIPLNYLTGNRQQRLQLLAGLLDTDGSYLSASNVFDFTNKNKNLFENVAQLCRGLGFMVCIQKPKKIKAFTTDNINIYYRMTISGNLEEIPTRVKRKQAIKTTKNKSSLVTGFIVEPVDFVEYYGFMADGDHRYLLADNTLTHNTQTMVKMAVAALVQSKNVGIFEGEMTEDKLGYRIDTFLGHIKNTAINRGDLYIQQEYKKYIDGLSIANYGTLRVLTPNGAGGKVTVNTLRAFIEKYHLDILFVDQYSLLEDTSYAKTSFERVGNIAKEIKQLQVKYQIPIIAVSQMNRTKNEDGSQDTTQIGLSDMIPQYATVLLMLDRDKNDRNKLTINIVKARDGGDGNKLDYVVNWDLGTFQYIPSEDDPVSSDAEIENIADSYAIDDDSPF